eukprot:TRINITY_DN22562_c0_g1_i1.p3 TRINITY_DN22562_c0_g1~~TRINITY_DN22562_c0_g1_i1.p3  ORF type:complete len:163 (+),score=52.07 TRINITY_DN22562_c0_g1_i1:324-812(+)
MPAAPDATPPGAWPWVSSGACSPVHEARSQADALQLLRTEFDALRSSVRAELHGLHSELHRFKAEMLLEMHQMLERRLAALAAPAAVSPTKPVESGSGMYSQPIVQPPHSPYFPPPGSYVPLTSSQTPTNSGQRCEPAGRGDIKRAALPAAGTPPPEKRQAL